MRTTIGTVIICLLCGCSHYDWETADDVLTGGTIAPDITIDGELLLGDADLATPVLLPLDISHPYLGDEALEVAFTQDESNPAGVWIAASEAGYTVTVPRNGVYQLHVEASSEGNRAQATIIVTASASSSFSIAGSVQDNLSPSPAQPIELRFLGGPAIETVTTGDDGGFRFDELIGDRALYEVIVAQP